MECPICCDVIEDGVITTCLHMACRSCLRCWFETKLACPVCRSRLTNQDYFTLPRENKFLVNISKEFVRSSKLSAVMSQLEAVIARNEKCVIFSNFLGFLD
jgi:DNA repair protein RAD5